VSAIVIVVQDTLFASGYSSRLFSKAADGDSMARYSSAMLSLGIAALWELVLHVIIQRTNIHRTGLLFFKAWQGFVKRPIHSIFLAVALAHLTSDIALMKLDHHVGDD